ncbi:hypothetical protein ABBQ38_006430 [Trebouxia sp. C0009 RCD-2024]
MPTAPPKTVFLVYVAENSLPCLCSRKQSSLSMLPETVLLVYVAENNVAENSLPCLNPSSTGADSMNMVTGLGGVLQC